MLVVGLQSHSMLLPQRPISVIPTCLYLPTAGLMASLFGGLVSRFTNKELLWDWAHVVCYFRLDHP